MVACTKGVHYLAPNGTVIRTYLTSEYTYAEGVDESEFHDSFFFAMNLDPDGTSFWTGGLLSGNIYRIDIDTGNQITTFNAGINTILGGLAIVGEILVGGPPLITLTPPAAQNLIDTDHTVTATVVDGNGGPLVGKEVIFTVTGPNAIGPAVSDTDGSGKVEFTYTGNNLGLDTIEACFNDDVRGELCATATKEWVLNLPPDCANAEPSEAVVWPPNRKLHAINVIGVADPDGDPITINIDSIRQDEPTESRGNGRFEPDGAGIDTETAEVRAERDTPGNGRVYHIGFTAFDGEGGQCSGEVIVEVPRNNGKKGDAIDDNPDYDSTI